MKRQAAIVLLLLAAPLVALSQTEKTVQRIRAVYNDASEQSRLAENDPEHGATGPLVMNELTVNSLNHQWRAVGIYQQRFRFFYRGGDSEEHLYPDELVLVKADRKVSARSYAEEFLFDKSGRLIFYFQRSENDDVEPVERRVYFAAGKAVRVIEDGRSRDRLGKQDTLLAGTIAAKSVQFWNCFKRTIEL